jgi:hypothetical protein
MLPASGISRCTRRRSRAAVTRSRLILDLLREATEPMRTKQIALQVMAHRGLNTVDDALVLTMTRRVGASLRSYRDNGAVRSIKEGRYGKYDLWEIARR